MAWLAIAPGARLRIGPGWLAALWGLAGCAGGGAPPALDRTAPAPIAPAATVAVPAAPEAASGWRAGLRPVFAGRQMVVSAHPLATEAGLAVLRAGGHAADAAVAVQAVLGLVEPQSSGLGGGAFALHFDAATGAVQTYDGRETAPAAAREDDLRWIDDARRAPPLPDPRASGRSIGTPGVPRLLEMLHADHGRRPWASLFDAGIRLAEDGFPIPARLADAIAANRDALRRDPDAAALYLDADGRARARGRVLRNPAYAGTLRALAARGADAFYNGPIARDIVAEIRRDRAEGTAGADRAAGAVDGNQAAGATDGDGAAGAITPGRTTASDLAGYRALRRPPVCADVGRWVVCGMGPPSSGGIAVAQALGILSHVELPPPRGAGDAAVPDPLSAHRIAEALRLAFADRNRWVADTDIVPLPARGVASLLDPAYLKARAAMIADGRSLGVAPPGAFGPRAGSDTTPEHGTSHLSIVDARGNAVAMTSSVESSLGAFRVVRGFVLNNQLTDFSAEPADADGPIANRLQAGKRPRSSMAPTLVFEHRPDGERGPLVMVTGSPGGAAIIAFVTKAVVATLDWGLDAQQAAALPHVAAFNTPATVLGGEHPAVAVPGLLDEALRVRGHRVVRTSLTSGVATILRVPGGWQGGVDPRREGLALGD